MVIEFLFLSLNPKLFTGKISISISGLFFLPKNAESLDDKNTAERANQFEVIK